MSGACFAAGYSIARCMTKTAAVSSRYTPTVVPIRFMPAALD
jgi:hypothetical protein